MHFKIVFFEVNPKQNTLNPWYAVKPAYERLYNFQKTLKPVAPLSRRRLRPQTLCLVLLWLAAGCPEP